MRVSEPSSLREACRGAKVDAPPAPSRRVRGGPLAGLLLALVLAGCADPPRASLATSSIYVATPDPLPPTLEWRTLGEGSLLVHPRASGFDVAVPAGALTVIVNQTFEAGGAYGILISFGGCVWDRPQTFIAIRQTIGADCGGLAEGAWPLQISTSAGAVAMSVEVVGLFCHESTNTWRCPPPAPPSTARA